MPRLLLSPLLALLVACTGTAAIEGKVHVGPGHEGKAVVAVLWQDLPAEDGGTELVALHQLAVGTVAGDSGEFSFTFHSLQAGRYVVGGYVDLNDDRLITTDEISVDLISPMLELDPEIEEKRIARRDVYIGMSAPDRGTISGVLRRSSLAARKSSEILVLDGPLTGMDSTVVGRKEIPAGAENIPFSIFNLPEGQLHVIAVDDLSLTGLVSIHDKNPVSISIETQREPSGIDLWLGRQAPGLGSVSGEVSLNASLPGASVQLWLFGADPTDPSIDAPLLGWSNASAGTSLSIPFRFDSIPLRTVYLGAGIATTSGGKTLSTTRVYRLGNSPTALSLSAETPVIEGLNMPMGVGKISGKISLTNAPKDLDLWTFAFPEGASSNTAPQQYDVFTTTSSGNFVLSYEMFGLEDGTYRMQLVPDVTGVDGPNDEIASSYVFNGTPATVTIVGGDRVASDFSVGLR